MNTYSNKNNEDFSIEKLIKSYSRYVYTIIDNFTKSKLNNEDVEEIISDVFFIIWKNRDKIDYSIDIKPYIAGITKNLIKNKYKKLHIEYSIHELKENLIDFSNETEDVYKKIDNKNMLLDKLKELNDTEYKIITMYYYEGKKIKEISKNLNLSVSKVKITLYRVRKKLEKVLKKDGYNYGE